MGIVWSTDMTNEIRSIPNDDPANSEALIRNLHDQILKISDEDKREQLRTELQHVACRGLEQELRELLAKRGLHNKGLYLVLNHITSLPELAEYLNLHSEDEMDNPELEVIKRRLGPNLEVLGALKAAYINVEEPWVKRLCHRAPSLVNLPRLSLPVLNECCKDADPGDMAEVQKLIEVAESPGKQLLACVGNQAEQNEGKKENDLKILNDATEAMARARELLAERKGNELTKKLNKETMESLHLSPEAKRPIEGLPPDQQVEKITKIIEENSNFVKTAENYSSFLEVVAKASAGRALCGIYYSKYEPSTTAPRPLLLLPGEVTIYNPTKTEDSNYMTFSEKSAAVDYIHMIESSSTNIGFGGTGQFGFQLTAKAQMEMQSDKGTETTQSIKAYTDNASVLLCSRKGKKAFQIEQSHMDVPMTVRKAAWAILANTNPCARQEAARSFLKRYGSHLPAGVHTLGGVFFRIAEATSESTINTTTLTKAATRQIDLQNSVGHKGGAADLGAEVKVHIGSSHITGMDAFAKREKARVTTSVKSMGPQASDLATFEQRLSYNSTWTIIDRGSSDGYIPVWELLKNRDEEFEKVANLLEETWRQDEQRREQISRKKKEKQIVIEELSNLKAKHLHRPQERARLSFVDCQDLGRRDKLTPDDAFTEAVNFVMENPRLNFCEITYRWALRRKRCALKYWKVNDDTAMDMRPRKEQGKHVLFFSESFFVWRNQIPRL